MPNVHLPGPGYMDTDGSPTKTAILEAHGNGQSHLSWEFSFGKRSLEELYQINEDPFLLRNLAENLALAAIKRILETQMEQELKDQGDPRMFGKGYIFDEYLYAPLETRNFYERHIIRGEKNIIQVGSMIQILNQSLEEEINLDLPEYDSDVVALKLKRTR